MERQGRAEPEIEGYDIILVQIQVDTVRRIAEPQTQYRQFESQPVSFRYGSSNSEIGTVDRGRERSDQSQHRNHSQDYRDAKPLHAIHSPTFS